MHPDRSRTGRMLPPLSTAPIPVWVNLTLASWLWSELPNPLSTRIDPRWWQVWYPCKTTQSLGRFGRQWLRSRWLGWRQTRHLPGFRWPGVQWDFRLPSRRSSWLHVRADESAGRTRHQGMPRVQEVYGGAETSVCRPLPVYLNRPRWWGRVCRYS